MFDQFIQIPESSEVRPDMRQFFLYAMSQNSDEIFDLARRIRSTSMGEKCLVKWMRAAENVTEQDLLNNLLNSRALIILVTPLLVSKIREEGLPPVVRMMQENGRRYFPIATNSVLLEDYCALDKAVHGLSLDSYAIDKELDEQMGKFFLSPEMMNHIREKAVVEKIFMSYRKDDTKEAQLLMRRIHDFPDFEGVSVWYDHFLTAGNDFNEIIFNEIDSCSAFVMAITPNTALCRPDGEDNFIVKEEYSRAVEKSRPIVPIIAAEGDCLNLSTVFKDIPDPVNAVNAENILRMHLSKLIPSCEYSSERLYYLGRAYHNGDFYEQDQTRAEQLFQLAADKTDIFALESSNYLATLYEKGDLRGVNYQDALTFRKRSVDLCEHIWGKEHPNTTAAYSNIAFVYYRQGDYPKALSWYQKALAIREKALGKEHPDTAAAYNNIASAYSRQGDYPKAFEWHQKALAIHEKALGREHPSTAAIYNNIASLYDSQGDYPKALSWYQKALAIREKVLGKEHPDTATIYNNIAGAYDSQGDYPKALLWYQKALAINEKALGKEHPDTAATYNNIASVYDRQGDYPKSFSWFQKALAIREKALGKEHPDTAAAYNNIASVYHRQGDYPKALSWYQKALAIDEKVLGKGHPSTATTYNNIAGVYDSQGGYPKALSWYQKALAIREKALGKEHPDTATSYNNIASVYSRQGDYSKALLWYQKALVIREKALGREHPSTATTYNNIALVYYRQGDYPKALSLCQNALAISEKALGKEHPSTVSIYNNIVNLRKIINSWPKLPRQNQGTKP